MLNPDPSLLTSSIPFVIQWPKLHCRHGMSQKLGFSKKWLSTLHGVVKADMPQLAQLCNSSISVLRRRCLLIGIHSIRNILTDWYCSYRAEPSLTASSRSLTSLFAADILSSDISYTFNTFSIFPEILVEKGDYLALRIFSGSRIPLCHLEYQKGAIECGYSTASPFKYICYADNPPRNTTLYEVPNIAVYMGGGWRTNWDGEIEKKNSTIKFLTIIDE